MRKALGVAGVIFVALLTLAPSAAAETPEDMANRISGEVMSPYCPGVTLHDCPSDGATEKRLEIEGWARSGWSEERIMTQLEDDFGQNIRANPAGTKGFVAWAIPAIMLAAGAATAVYLSKRWSSGAPFDDEARVAPEDHQRVESELRLLREEGGT